MISAATEAGALPAQRSTSGSEPIAWSKPAKTAPREPFSHRGTDQDHSHGANELSSTGNNRRS